MREKYKNNVAWLFKRITTDGTVSWEVDGAPFYCNQETVKKSRFNAMANQYKSVADEIVKTTTQLNFETNDRIAFTPEPRNNADFHDFGIIINIDEKPYMERGNKFRNTVYKEFWLTLS